MKQTGIYSPYIENEKEFDIDHRINQAIEETKKMIADLENELNVNDCKLVLKAIASELIESL